MLERQLAALVAAAPRETVASVAAAAAATHAAAASGGLPPNLAAAAEEAVDGGSSLGRRGSVDSPGPALEAVPMASTRVVVSEGGSVGGEGGREPAGFLPLHCQPPLLPSHHFFPFSAFHAFHPQQVHQIVTPADVDPAGVCYAGIVLSWIDVAAGLAAKTLARGPVVTASVDAVHFLRPARLGAVTITAAQVNRVFRSSAEVGVRVEEEAMDTGERVHCCSAYLTFVSVARAAVGPIPAMPPVAPSSPSQVEVWEAAAVRRASRLARRAAARAAPDAQPPRLRPVTHREGSPTLAPPVCAPPPAPRPPLNPGLDRLPPPPPLLPVPPSATRAHMTQLVLPQHANSLGITFGGQVMRWMEQTAWIAASRVAGRGGHTHLLTAAMDSVAFAAPSRVGDVLYVSAQVTAIWGASMEVMVSVCAETPALGAVFECGDAFVTVVAVQRASGAPSPVPFRLAVPDAGPDAVRAAGAAARREERLAMRAALRAHDARRPSLDGTRRGGGGGLGGGWGGVRAAAAAAAWGDGGGGGVRE